MGTTVFLYVLSSDISLYASGLCFGYAPADVVRWDYSIIIQFVTWTSMSYSRQVETCILGSRTHLVVALV